MLGSLGNIGNFTKLTSKYRTGVVNDFSIVTKAVFYVFKGKKGEYKLDEALPVQINPNSFRDAKDSNDKSIWDILHSDGSTRDNPKRSLTLSLIYDIYDEYNIRTMDGLITTGDDLIFSSLSLENEDITTLPKIKNVACHPDRHVLFKWGQFKYFGRITSVDCTYSTFSRWGEPLKGTAEVTLDYSYENGYNSSFSVHDILGDEIDSQVKIYELPSQIANKAALGMTQAAR